MVAAPQGTSEQNPLSRYWSHVSSVHKAGDTSNWETLETITFTERLHGRWILGRVICAV